MKRSPMNRGTGFAQTGEIGPKTCAHCGTSFIPFRPMARVCSPVCATRWVKASKKDEAATTRARKEAIKTIPKLLREAQIAFNAWIRARDHAQPCISCPAPPPDMAGLHAGRDAGHYRSVGSAPQLRFHEDNVHAQCVHCNQWGAGKAVEYRIGLLARIGPARVDLLETTNGVHKWQADELRAIRDTYRLRLKQLQKAAE